MLALSVTVGCASAATPEEVWNKTFGGAKWDYPNAVLQTSDNGYIFAGETSSYGAGAADMWLVKTDSNGNEEWNRTFGGTSRDEASSLRQTSDGGYIIVGYTNSYGAGSSDAWLIKLKGEPTILIFDTESIELYGENNTLIANGSWNGYIGDYHNITIHNLTGKASYVTLLKNHEYRYVIKTGSYPQIIHEPSKGVTGGTITCDQFIDANGVVHYDWIPAIRLYDLQN